MPHPPAPRRQTLSLDRLEQRELPAAAPWLAEPFQRSTATGLPSGWAQWSSDDSRAFRVNPGVGGLGDQGLLVSSAASDTSSRAWLSAPFAADVETSAAVYLNSASPVHLFVRGSDLNSSSPTYYAVAVTRGAEVRLLKMVDGKTTVLGSVRSDEYLTNRWATITIRAEGNQLKVSLHRGDTNQYLDADGGWGRRPTAAVQVTDRSIGGGGRVGFARPAKAAGAIALDSLRVGAPKAATAPITEERFDRGPGLPAGWSQWSTPSPASFRTFGDETLRVDAGSDSTARAWVNAPTGSDAQVSSSIFVDSLVQAGVFARVEPRHRHADLLLGDRHPRAGGQAVEGGRRRRHPAGHRPLAGLAQRPVGADLAGPRRRPASGTDLPLRHRAVPPARRLLGAGPDLRADSDRRRDQERRAGWAVARHRVRRAAGVRQLRRDLRPRADGPPPIPTGGDKPTAPKPPPDDLPGTDSPPPVVPPPVVAPTEPNGPVLTRPQVNRSYDWIRLANLAYYGTPLTGFEKDLLKNSIDLVIPNLAYLDDIAAINPDTPQFIYTNVSNIYLNLLTDWNAYADRNGLDRESAFYHVNRATRYDGMSASAVPVNQFWGVYRGSGADWKNVTRSAQVNESPLDFGGSGESVALGFIEKFREVNVDLLTGAAGGWSAQLEYVAAVDADGRPTQWKPLATLSDTTNGLRRDGRLTFDPPRDWVAASLGNGSRLFYVRFRTTHDGVAPVAKSVLGRDYTDGGKIPAFDYAADRDRDGYLSDAEWAGRRDGFDARFEYEGRLFYPNYGPLRFASNVSDPGFRAWASDYHARFAASQPLVRGFFVDNSIGRLAVDTSGLRESLTGYSSAYGSLLGAINRRLAVGGRWLIANTVGGNSSAEPVVRNGVSYLEEFALRPLSANHVQFDDLSATLRYRRQISGGKAYEILDTLPSNGDAGDPRMQLASLAMYYALADPDLSFLMVNGGNEPASSWKRHWIGAAEFDVGRPLGKHSVVAKGRDPADGSLVYKVYGRRYENALVLYKPLSYTRGETGGIGAATATMHRLDGWYRVVNADGSLGARVNQVSLRNGEGVVLAESA